MRLILHIGTHKTATTTIQHFLALNRKNLLKNRIYFPHNDYSAYHMNNLASQLANNKAEETKEYMNNCFMHACKLKMHNVLISGESFYAMTGFFKILAGKELNKKEYFSFEEKFINDFKDFCFLFDEVKVLCALRSQEEYANSLYNQLVKNCYGIDYGYSLFLEKIKFILDYKSHLDLWAKSFGKSNMIIFDFEKIRSNPIKFFCEMCFEQKLKDCDSELKIHSNKRLSRDILEFKKIQNRKKISRAKRYVSIQPYHQLSYEYPDKKNWQIFASLSERKKFFKLYDKGNVILSNAYNLEKLKSSNELNETSYIGLDNRKYMAIEKRLNNLLRSPQNIIELLIREFLNKLIKLFPKFDKFLIPIRSFRNYIRLKIENW